MKTLPLLASRARRTDISPMQAALLVALNRAAVVELAGRYLAEGHSLTATAHALSIPVNTLSKLVNAARRDGPAGLVPRNWNSGRRPDQPRSATSSGKSWTTLDA